MADFDAKTCSVASTINSKEESRIKLLAKVYNEDVGERVIKQDAIHDSCFNSAVVF